MIFNHFHPGTIIEEDNIFMCEKLTGLKTLACVKTEDENLDIDFETLSGLYK